MSTAAKKTPARRSPKAAPAAQQAPANTEEVLEELGFVGEDKPIGADGEIRAVRIGRRGRTPNPLVDLFEIDGVMYQIPAKPSPMLTFRYQQDVLRAMSIRDEKRRDAAHFAATRKYLVALLGEEAMDALAESADVTEDDVADIFAIVAHIAFGTESKVREAQGNS